MNIASRLWNADIDVPFLFPAVQKWTAFSISKRKENFKSYEKDIEAISHRLPCLCNYRYRFADNGSPRFREAILDRKAERVGIVEKVMNDGSIGSTFNEGHMTVEGEDAFCVDINTNFRNGYKTRADASTRMSYDQISDVALSIEYVNQYVQSHSGLSSQHIYLLKQCVVWQRLSVHLGWQCDNVRASYDEIPKAIQDEVYVGAKAFASENKGRYECGGYIHD